MSLEITFCLIIMTFSELINSITYTTKISLAKKIRAYPDVNPISPKDIIYSSFITYLILGVIYFGCLLVFLTTATKLVIKFFSQLSANDLNLKVDSPKTDTTKTDDSASTSSVLITLISTPKSQVSTLLMLFLLIFLYLKLGVILGIVVYKIFERIVGSDLFEYQSKSRIII